MSATVDIVVLRRIAGHHKGQIVTGVDVNDERWAGHIMAGNATVLDHHEPVALTGSGLQDDEDHVLEYGDVELEEE